MYTLPLSSPLVVFAPDNGVLANSHAVAKGIVGCTVTCRQIGLFRQTIHQLDKHGGTSTFVAIVVNLNGLQWPCCLREWRVEVNGSIRNLIPISF
jgi:hypothetical protein